MTTASRSTPRRSTGRAGTGTVSFGGFAGGVLSPLRTLSFWTMKDRGRVVGETGAHPVPGRPDAADREECYVESDDREFSGHFRIRRAYLSRNRFRMAFGRSPVREIAVWFDATDSVYTEVERVLQIMIPAFVIS